MTIGNPLLFSSLFQHKIVINKLFFLRILTWYPTFIFYIKKKWVFQSFAVSFLQTLPRGFSSLERKVGAADIPAGHRPACPPPQWLSTRLASHCFLKCLSNCLHISNPFLTACLQRLTCAPVPEFWNWLMRTSMFLEENMTLRGILAQTDDDECRLSIPKDDIPSSCLARHALCAWPSCWHALLLMDPPFLSAVPCGLYILNVLPTSACTDPTFSGLSSQVAPPWSTSAFPRWR